MIEWDLGLVVLSEYVEGFLQVAVDLYGPGASGRSLEVVHPLGFLSRPRDPDVDAGGGLGRGAGTLYGFDGSRGWAFPTTDPRFVSLVPELKKGGAVMYSAPGAFILIDGDNGTTQLYVPHGETASTIAIDVTTAGEESIQIRHGLGMGITITAGGKNSIVINNKNGDAYVEVNDEGITLNGNTMIVGGLVAGGTGAQPVMLAGAGVTGLIGWIAQANTAFAALQTLGFCVAPVAVPLPSTKVSAAP